MSNTVGKYTFRKIREDLKMSRKEFAESINVSAATIKNIEKGSTQLLNDAVLRVSEKYGIPAPQVMGYETAEDFALFRQNAKKREAEDADTIQKLILERDELKKELEETKTQLLKQSNVITRLLEDKGITI